MRILNDFGFAFIHLSVMELPDELQTMTFIESNDRTYVTKA